MIKVGSFHKIDRFIEDLDNAGLLIEVKSNTWIPNQNNSIEELEIFDKLENNVIILSVEEGVDFFKLKEQMSDFKISQIKFYGSNSGLKITKNIFTGIQVDHVKKDQNKCSRLAVIRKGDILKTDSAFYNYSRIFNNCWGRSIAITKDEIIRPCIYSEIKICNLDQLKSLGIIDKIEKYWYLSKDKVEKCKVCELRYSCFDCRETAWIKSNGNLYAKNPYCNYDPETGVWKEEKKL